MAYEEALAERVRRVLRRRRGVTERKMFGGLAFLVNGHMSCGVIEKELVLRLGERGAQRALDEPHTREMDFTGRPLKSMVYVETAGLRSEEALANWVRRALTYVRSLPPKSW